MSGQISSILLQQHEVAWKLASYHFEDLSTAECLWRPSSIGLHINADSEGWRGHWPESESYDLGPPSIAWILWHIGYWWSMTINYSFDDGQLCKDSITCPDNAADAVTWIESLHDSWISHLRALTDSEMQSAERSRFPYHERAFSDVAAWLNIELTKNAAEIGYARFLYATRAIT
jgi:hypothetical protein